jgi:hypothetical protein
MALTANVAVEPSETKTLVGCTAMIGREEVTERVASALWDPNALLTASEYVPLLLVVTPLNNKVSVVEPEIFPPSSRFVPFIFH